MSLGILKLFRTLLLIIIISVFVSCSYKEVYYKIFSSKKEKLNFDNNISVSKDNNISNIDKNTSIADINNTKIVNDTITINNDAIYKQENINEKEIKPQEIKNVLIHNTKEKKILVKQDTNIIKETKKIIKIQKDINNNIKIDLNTNLKRSTKLSKHNLDQFRFDFIKKGVQDDNTFLIVAGIQGDEPGGFMAASLIATHYKITKGSVWVVPNLNFYSIIKRSRGPFGDMNRKFANLSKSDPEYEIVQRIKNYITNPNVKLILNLHDGSGYYRPMYIDKNHQPLKWGQCLVIDQEVLPDVKEYADTYIISEQIVKYLNNNLLKEEDIYRTKNTHTRFKKTFEEQDMAKTLTYFAVTNGKSAFGHETSKSLSVPQRVYYKLLAMEKFMDIMGIKYKRNFDMTISDIKKVMNDDISIKFDDTDIKMPLKDIRNIQNYFPVDKNGVIKYLPSNPLIKIIKFDNSYTIYYGNRRLTKLQADYAEHLNFETKINFIIDGIEQEVKFGDTINVSDSFLIKSDERFRVNVIGYKNKTNIETNVNIHKKQFIKRYSIEKNANMYRIEFYKNKKFAGMILVNYL